VFKLIWAKKFLLLILVLLVALLPMAMSRESVALSKTIFTAMGIDKVDGEYIVYGEAFIFNFDPFGVMEREIVIGKGDTIDDAMAEIGRNMGKTVSLSHCTVMILGKGLGDENFLDLLKPFVVTPQFSNSCVIFYTQDDVGEIMQLSLDTGDARSGRIHQIAEFNRRHEKFHATTLDKFFRSSLRGDKTASVAILSISDDIIQNEGIYATFIDGLLQ